MCKNSAGSCRYPKESDRCWVSTKVLNIPLHPPKGCDLIQVRPVPAGVLVTSAERRAAEPPLRNSDNTTKAMPAISVCCKVTYMVTPQPLTALHSLLTLAQVDP